MMAKPRLLLLDKPSMGLAPILVETIFETIANINRQGVTILSVEQNALRALEIADWGYVLPTRPSQKPPGKGDGSKSLLGEN